MDEKKQKIVKRYQNRKLYDTVDSCYVTLEDISDMIKMGDDVRVIDNRTKEDLTAMTFAQIIFEEQKRKTNVMPLSIFTQLIRQGGEAIKEILSKTLQSGVREMSHVRETMETVQHLPELQGELTSLRKKIDSLERQLRTPSAPKKS